MKPKTKIAIACQGGGSQTAFTAGALKALCEARISDEFELVSISGTSGGAVCAALIWFAFEKGEDPLWGRLLEFWKDNTAQGWLEQTFNQFVISALRRISPVKHSLNNSSSFTPICPNFTAAGSRPWKRHCRSQREQPLRPRPCGV